MIEIYLASRDKLLISPWAADDITWAVEHGILTGDGTNNLKPRAFVTKEHAAKSEWRTLR